MSDSGNNTPDSGNNTPDSGNNTPDSGNNTPDNGNNAPTLRKYERYHTAFVAFIWALTEVRPVPEGWSCDICQEDAPVDPRDHPDVEHIPEVIEYPFRINLAPACSHVFHLGCLFQWVTSDQENCNRCPMCRTLLYGPEYEDDDDEGEDEAAERSLELLTIAQVREVVGNNFINTPRWNRTASAWLTGTLQEQIDHNYLYAVYKPWRHIICRLANSIANDMGMFQEPVLYDDGEMQSWMNPDHMHHGLTWIEIFLANRLDNHMVNQSWEIDLDVLMFQAYYRLLVTEWWESEQRRRAREIGSHDGLSPVPENSDPEAASASGRDVLADPSAGSVEEPSSTQSDREGETTDQVETEQSSVRDLSNTEAASSPSESQSGSESHDEHDSNVDDESGSANSDITETNHEEVSSASQASDGVNASEYEYESDEATLSELEYEYGRRKRMRVH